MNPLKSKLRDDAAEKFSYVPEELPDLPSDDTSPDEHGNEPEPCVRCEREPAIAFPVQTTNRGLDCVNGRVYIDPVCDGHASDDTNRVVWRLLSYGDVEFVASAIMAGVVSQTEAFSAIDDGPTEDYFFVPDNATFAPAETRADLIDELEARDTTPNPPA